MGNIWLNLTRRIQQELDVLDRDARRVIGISLAVLVLVANFLLFVVWKQIDIKPLVIMILCMVTANVSLAGVSLYYSYDIWKEIRAFKLESKETTGKVVRVESNCWDDVGVVYYPIIEYKAEGKIYVLWHHLYSPVVNRYKLGDTYRLVYCSERPERAEFFPYPVWKKRIKLFFYGVAGVIASGSLVGFLYLLIFAE